MPACLRVTLIAGVTTLVVLGSSPLLPAQTTLVSREPGGFAFGGKDPVISGDGRFVAFSSAATNLVANDTNGRDDIFLRDRQAETTNRISLGPVTAQGNAHSVMPRISADGCQVAFESDATNLVVGDTNLATDIFAYDCQTGTISRVSVASDGSEANDRSYDGAISANGRFVTFASGAGNLVANDANGWVDIFVRDRQSGVTTRVSVASDGSEADSNSYRPALSANGRYVVFASYASNLVADDSNGFSDIFRHELDLSPEVVSISRADASPTAAASVTFTVTFSEPVTGVTADDFTLTTTGSIQGAAVSGVSGSGDSYTVTVATGSGLGDIRLDVAATAEMVDASGKLLANRPFTGGQVYTIVEQAETHLFLPLIVR